MYIILIKVGPQFRFKNRQFFKTIQYIDCSSKSHLQLLDNYFLTIVNFKILNYFIKVMIPF